MSTKDTILRDLNHKLLDKVIEAISDVHSLCKVVEIFERRSSEAIVATLLFLVMDLMHHMTPGLTPQGFANIILTQYTHYLKTERERTQND